MAKIEDLIDQAGGDWAGIDQITPTLRIGYTNNFLLVEKTKLNPDGSPGDVGVYNLPHIPSEKMADFLAELAAM